MVSDLNPWTFVHSVECSVPVAFAWTFWTDVSNWSMDPDVKSLKLDGPFAAGSRGTTHSRSSGKVEWQIVEVGERRAVIEFPLPDAVGRFTWTFEDLGGRTRITQHCTLTGEQASAYATAVGPSLEADVPLGMRSLSMAMEKAAK